MAGFKERLPFPFPKDRNWWLSLIVFKAFDLVTAFKACNFQHWREREGEALLLIVVVVVVYTKRKREGEAFKA